MKTNKNLRWIKRLRKDAFRRKQLPRKNTNNESSPTISSPISPWYPPPYTSQENFIITTQFPIKDALTAYTETYLMCHKLKITKMNISPLKLL